MMRKRYKVIERMMKNQCKFARIISLYTNISNQQYFSEQGA